MSRSGRLQGGDGLNGVERDIMARWDAGCSIEQIAQTSGRTRQAVGKIVATFHISGPADRDGDAVTRAASLRYAAALAATGKRYA